MSDDLAVDPYNDLEQLQKTEEVSHPQSQSQSGSAELWGYLSPCLSRSINRVDLHRDSLEVTVGRSPNNQVMFPGLKISNYHAVIQWNGLEYADSVITIEDKSSNGTFINGEKIGKGRQRILKDGNEVAFGVASTSTEQNGLFDYRFIFRDLVPGVVKRELYKSYDMSVELGKGSSATVYKALHMASGQWVAVKVIHKTKHQGLQPSTASEAAQIGRSRMSSREIDIMETLRHPNICLLREAFWNANGSIDLVLELVEGGDLLDFILMNNGLTEAMTKHMTFQLCQALSYIHSRGITHRNLKPENILLTKDHPPIVKVADFGLAGIVDSMIMLKIMPGTPFYLAPEVVSQQNNSEYDSLVDSWSVGVIVFSMLTNTSPFLANSMEDLKTLIAQRNIDWVQLEMLKFGNSEEGYYGLSDEVHDFIRQLLDFDPRQRMKLSDALSHPWLKNHKLPFPMDYPRIQDNMKISLRDINGKYVDVPVEDCRTWQSFCNYIQAHSYEQFVVRLENSTELLFKDKWDKWILSLGHDHPDSLPRVELCNIQGSCGCMESIDSIKKGFCDTCGVQFLEDEEGEQQTMEQEHRGDHGENLAMETDNKNKKEVGRVTHGTQHEKAETRKEDENKFNHQENPPQVPSTLSTMATGVQATTTSFAPSNSVVRRHKRPEKEKFGECPSPKASEPDEELRRSTTVTALVELDQEPGSLLVALRYWSFQLSEMADLFARTILATYIFLIAPPFVRDKFTGDWDTTRLQEYLQTRLTWGLGVFGALFGAQALLASILDVSSSIAKAFLVLSCIFSIFGLMYSVQLFLGFRTDEDKTQLLMLFHNRPSGRYPSYWDLSIMMSLPFTWMVWGIISLMFCVVTFVVQSFILDLQSSDPDPSKTVTKIFVVSRFTVSLVTSMLSMIYLAIIYNTSRKCRISRWRRGIIEVEEGHELLVMTCREHRD